MLVFYKCLRKLMRITRNKVISLYNFDFNVFYCAEIIKLLNF
jgi:hypothetical protein